MFSLISANSKKIASIDALDAYLETPPLASVDDPLYHWNLVLQSSKDTNSPTCALTCMALDFLSVPGMYKLIYSSISLSLTLHCSNVNGC